MTFEQYIGDVGAWAVRTPAVQAVVLVGSYARGTNNAGSDIDLVILTDEKPEFVGHPAVFAVFGSVARQRIEYYGAVTSVRVWYQGGFEVEYGISEPTWISRPLDPGTKNVLRDGYRVVFDRYDLFNNLDLS